MNNSFRELVSKLAENEMAISRLYEQFAETFSEDEKFWSELSREEILHFNWLKQLQDFVDKEKIGTRPTSLRSDAVTTSIDYLNSLRDKCRNGVLTREKAFSLAYDVENSLLEKNFFTIFEFAGTPYRRIQNEMTRQTRTHREKIGEAVQKIKDAKTS